MLIFYFKKKKIMSFLKPIRDHFYKVLKQLKANDVALRKSIF